MPEGCLIKTKFENTNRRDKSLHALPAALFAVEDAAAVRMN